MESTDLEVPKSVLARVLRSELPAGSNIGKDALAAAQVAARVFMSYTASMAQDIAQQQGRKTVSADDIMATMQEIEFPQFEAPLAQARKDFQSSKAKKQRKAAAEPPADSSNPKAKAAKQQTTLTQDEDPDSPPREDNATVLAAENEDGADAADQGESEAESK